MLKTATTAALAAILLRSATALAAGPVCGDVNGNDDVSASDAQLVLKKGVGQSITLDCSAYDDQFSACEMSLAEANSSLSACNGSLATANAGTAEPGDVLAGKTFTSESGIGVVGTLSSCGNGAIDDGESCDSGNLNSETCSTQTAGAKPYGTLHCAAGCAQFETAACKPRFEARYWNGSSTAGDKTVFDNQTGLEWVVTDDAGGLADKDNTYTWSTGDDGFNGTARTVYLDGLNDVAGGGAGCFAGHCDWRLPGVANNGGDAELETILLAPYPCGTDPCIDESVFGPTSIYYWSSTTYLPDLSQAWQVGFGDLNDGQIFRDPKTDSLSVRAVRGERYFSSSVGGDATVLDRLTGLEWVVTDDDGGLADKDNTYTWSTGDDGFNGTARTVYLDGLNDVAGGGAGCFAGHCDWRLPGVANNGGDAELETILLAPYPCGTDPCIDESVFGPTSIYYWSSTTYLPDLSQAWQIGFGDLNDGQIFRDPKTESLSVRAVRGGF